ncbi:MAG: transposase [Thermoplasmatales archaeon]
MKANEKHAIIKEVKENGKVVETCRKYSVDPSKYYKWKEFYDTFGLDGLKPHYRRMGPDVRKLMREKEKLKKLRAEKELEKALLSESIKKR